MSSRKIRISTLARQSAALPVAMQGGETVVMLVTSRDTGRWVLPKGWAEKKLSGAQLAAKEAFEEGGILGDTLSAPIGAYHYAKHLPNGKAVQCRVEVFPLYVKKLLDEWPEAKQRRREWFTLPQAAMLVDEGELVTLLLRLRVSDPLLPAASKKPRSMLA